ncbi:DnaJ domain-containing protein, partial [Powellomyces hirtus]
MQHTQDSKQDRTFYQILRISPDATPAEIKTAYRRLALQLHPDKNGGKQDEFLLIGEANYILSDPRLRAQYDLSLAEKSRPRSWDSANFGGSTQSTFARQNHMPREEGVGLEDLLRQFRNDARSRGLDFDYFRQMAMDPEAGIVKRVLTGLWLGTEAYLDYRDSVKES